MNLSDYAHTTLVVQCITVSVLTSSAVDHRFKPWSDETQYKITIGCFFVSASRETCLNVCRLLCFNELVKQKSS